MMESLHALSRAGLFLGLVSFFLGLGQWRFSGLRETLYWSLAIILGSSLLAIILLLLD